MQRKQKMKSTYEILAEDLDKIARKIRQIGEQSDLPELSLLSSQLKAIKEDLARLLWIELPELNDGAKFEQLFNRSTGFTFSPGIFEIDAMRQAFFRRQVQRFFMTRDEQQAYIQHTENLYLSSTKTLKEIMQETSMELKDASHQEKQKQNIEQFTSAMNSI
ncbi:hypothetical protein [Streptococcus ruminantium]|uniref:hypothetical protein n=1 Tax=Streptococcus ruminantium TaxID=1917441 RepID=UPI001D146C76|nr:hypothetical protein [Streptococcus ruminantium]